MVAQWISHADVPSWQTDRHRWVMKTSQLGRKAYRILFPLIELSWDSGGLLKFHTTPSHPCLVWAPCSMHCLIGVWKQWGCLFRLHSLQMHHSIASISMCFPWKWGKAINASSVGDYTKITACTQPLLPSVYLHWKWGKATNLIKVGDSTQNKDGYSKICCTNQNRQKGWSTESQFWHL